MELFDTFKRMRFSLVPLLAAFSATFWPLEGTARDYVRSRKAIGGMFVGISSDKQNLKKIDEAYVQLGLRKIRRSKIFSIDLVVPKSDLLAEDEKALKTSCRRLMKVADGIEFCDIAREYKTSASSHSQEDAVNDPAESFCDPFGKRRLRTLLPGLSPYWAQDLVGADLAREYVNSLYLGNLQPVSWGTLEYVQLDAIPKDSLTPGLKEKGASFAKVEAEDHGSLVANLVNHPNVAAGSNKLLKLGVSRDVSQYGYQSDELLKTADLLIEQDVKLICSSLGFSHNPFDTKVRDKLDKSNIIFVQSSGNDFPNFSNYKPPENVIMVGSLSPVGLPSHFSSPNKQVIVSAPGDNYIYSSMGHKPTPFSGTSATQPLTCGSVGNVIALLPGITSSEVQKLLRKTAISTGNSFEKPPLNGQGMVNAYKLARVADRLRDHWPENRERISIDPALYNFKSEALEFSKQAQILERGRGDCSLMKRYRALRAAWLLDQGNPIHGNRLASMFREQGFTYNEKFILAGKPLTIEQLLALARSKDVDVASSAIRQLMLRPASGASSVVVPILKSQFRFGADSRAVFAGAALIRYGQKQFVQTQFVKRFSVSSDDQAEDILLSALEELKLPVSPFLPWCAKKSASLRQLCSNLARARK